MKKILLASLFLFCGLAWVLAQDDKLPFDEHGQSAPMPPAWIGASMSAESAHPWTAIGPFGGDVVDIALDPMSDGYAYIAAGLPYMRTSTDEPWQLVESLLSLSPSGIHCIESNSGGTLFAGGTYTNNKIFISNDQGATWSQKFIAINAGAMTIAIDAGDESNMYVGTISNISGSTNKVISRSEDGGETWTSLDMTSQFPLGMACNGIAVDPDNSDVVVALGDGGFSFYPKIIITQDGCATWTDITAGLPAGKPLNDVLIHDGSIYVCGGQLFGGNTMGIFKSDDYGQSWLDISLGFPVKVVNDLAIDPEDPTLMYAATEGDGIYYSVNGGLTWNYDSGGAGDNGSARKVALSPFNTSEVYAGFLSLGVCLSDDGGLNWTSSTVGISSLKLNDIETDPNDPEVILASFEAENSGGCYLFDPAAGDWALVGNLPATRFSAVSIGIDGRMYAWSNGPTTVAPEGVYRSDDGGQTWENMGPDIGSVFETQIFALALSDSDPGLIFIGGNNFGANGWASMIYRSTDAGESWENVYMGPEFDGFRYIHVAPGTGDQVVYAAYKTESSGAGFIKSTDGGSTWLPINDGIPAAAKWAGAIITDTGDPDILYGGVGGYGGMAGKIYKSMDGGSSWEPLNISLGNYSKISDLVQSPLHPEVIYAATTLDGVYWTEDGLNWSPANDGLPATNITGFSRIFENDEGKQAFLASTFSNSAFTTEVFDPGWIGTAENTSGITRLMIVPNPNRGSFHLRITDPETRILALRVADISGKMVFDRDLPVGGEELAGIRLDLVPGIYFLAAVHEKGTTVEKLVVE